MTTNPRRPAARHWSLLALSPLLGLACLLTSTCQNQSPPPTGGPPGPAEAPPPIERPVIDPAAHFSSEDCGRQVQAIERLFRDRTDDRMQQLREILRLAAMYDQVKVVGTEAALVEQSCGKPLRDLSQDLALMLHKQAQRQRDNRSRVIAAELYRRHAPAISPKPRLLAICHLQAHYGSIYILP